MAVAATPFMSTLDCGADKSTGGTPLVIYRIESATTRVVLTAPHGGHTKYGAQALEMHPRPAALPGVVTKSDLHTLDLLAAIDEYVRQHTQTQPHIVAARFHRQYIDANRNARVGSQVAVHPECEKSRQLYDEYHGCIGRCIDHALAKDPHARVLLLDLHGMKPYTDFIAVGSLNGMTYDGATVNEPLMGFLFHLRSLLGSTVLPLPGAPDFPQYAGGFTVQRHGLGPRVDAFQLEFGSFLRQVEVRRHVAAAVGEAIVRALQPMPAFLAKLRSHPEVGWTADGVLAVDAKLRRVYCYTPRDLRQQLPTINAALVAQGARKFSRGTLQAMRDALDARPAPAVPGTTAGAEAASSLLQPAAATAADGAQKGASVGKLLPRDFLRQHHARLWTSSVADCDEERQGLRNILRRIFVSPVMLHQLLQLAPVEVAAVSALLRSRCDHSHGHLADQSGSSTQAAKAGATVLSDGDGAGAPPTVSGQAFWPAFLQGVSFSCAPALCHSLDRECRFVVGDTHVADGHVLTFADGGEFNRKLRDWYAYVAARLADLRIASNDAECPRWGTAAALLLDPDRGRPPPMAPSVSGAISTPAPPPLPPPHASDEGAPCGDEALCRAVVLYLQGTDKIAMGHVSGHNLS